jgi:hypothetical protein
MKVKPVHRGRGIWQLRQGPCSYELTIETSRGYTTDWPWITPTHALQTPDPMHAIKYDSRKRFAEQRDNIANDN